MFYVDTLIFIVRLPTCTDFPEGFSIIPSFHVELRNHERDSDRWCIFKAVPLITDSVTDRIEKRTEKHFFVYVPGVYKQQLEK